MAVKTKQELQNFVNSFIKQNENSEITGTVLNTVLLDILDTFFNSIASESFLIRNTIPNNSEGNDNDTYLDTTTAIIYKKELGIWVSKLDFNTLINNNKFLSGNGTPQITSDLVLNDHYIDLDRLDLYKYNGASWNLISTSDKIYSITPTYINKNWVDGKQIYRVVITESNITTYPHIITHNLNVDKYINVSGFSWDSNNTTIQIDLHNPNFNIGEYTTNSINNINSISNYDNIQIILEYTIN